MNENTVTDALINNMSKRMDHKRLIQPLLMPLSSDGLFSIKTSGLFSIKTLCMLQSLPLMFLIYPYLLYCITLYHTLFSSHSIVNHQYGFAYHYHL
jgi:hypothetical protein